MVLNEPEASLHPDLLAPLARLIAAAAARSQVILVSHAPALPVSLKLGFGSELYGYAIDLGLPVKSGSTMRKAE